MCVPHILSRVHTGNSALFQSGNLGTFVLSHSPSSLKPSRQHMPMNMSSALPCLTHLPDDKVFHDFLLLIGGYLFRKLFRQDCHANALYRPSITNACLRDVYRCPDSFGFPSLSDLNFGFLGAFPSCVMKSTVSFFCGFTAEGSGSP